MPGARSAVLPLGSARYARLVCCAHALRRQCWKREAAWDPPLSGVRDQPATRACRLVSASECMVGCEEREAMAGRGSPGPADATSGAAQATWRPRSSWPRARRGAPTRPPAKPLPPPPRPVAAAAARRLRRPCRRSAAAAASARTRCAARTTCAATATAWPSCARSRRRPPRRRSRGGRPRRGRRPRAAAGERAAAGVAAQAPPALLSD